MALITVATWNMHQEQRAWNYLDLLRDEHGVQVALLQEAVAPVEPERWLCVTPDPLDRELWRISVPPAVRRRAYASAIVLLDERLSLTPQPAAPLAEAGYDTFAASHPGQFAVARVQHPDAVQEVVLISLYGLWHTPSGNGAEATVHRALSDLTVLFLATQPVVLAGDLNLFRNTNNPGQRRFDTVFSRLEAYDFHLAGPLLPAGATRRTDCTCGQGDNCDHVETFRMFRPGALSYQDDYVFARGAITTQSCAALVDTAIRDQRLSDHWPVIAQFDLP